MEDHEHHRPTSTARQYIYLFTRKHHGHDPNAAQWHSELTEDEEFSVFEWADQTVITDDYGNLYGALSDGQESLRELGTRREQVAKFPCAPTGSPWHGYPAWVLGGEGAGNRRSQKNCPPRAVFVKMAKAGLIVMTKCKRLMGGKHI